MRRIVQLRPERFTCISFFYLVFCRHQTFIGQRKRISVISIMFYNLLRYSKFRLSIIDSVDVESHCPKTESTRSEFPCQLSQCRIIKISNILLKSTNVCKSCIYKLQVDIVDVEISRHVDSVNVESNSAEISPPVYSVC